MSRPDIIHFLPGGSNLQLTICDSQCIMVKVAQLVRALDCGSRGRGFESRLSPFAGGPNALFAFGKPGMWLGVARRDWRKLR